MEVVTVPNMDALDNYCYWVKQVVALAAGVAGGVLPLTGFVTLITMMLAVLLSSYGVCVLLRTEFDALGVEKQMEILKEGLQSAIGTFLLSWIVVYTFVQA